MKKISLLLLLPLVLFSKHKHYEHWYQKIAAKKLDGVIEYRLRDRTRIDILTKDHAIEVDFAHKCYEAIGQSLYYAFRTSKRAGIVLIVENSRLDARYLDICMYMAKKEKITLWVIHNHDLVLIK